MPPAYISTLDRALHEGFPRGLIVLGSTGSIGASALAVVEEQGAGPEGRFQVVGLAGARNVRLLAEQAARFRPRVLGVLTEAGREELQGLLPSGYAPDIVVGRAGYEAMARHPDAPLVLSAQVGAAGLAATVAAVRAGKTVALANKESLVLAGDIIRRLAFQTGAAILPVDSEHNALFQALAAHSPITDAIPDLSQVARLLLTASGGPFVDKDAAFLEQVTADQALKHPNWDMGAKITIDSSTLMNKGLEFIEAHHLFGFPPEAIEVVVHRESVVHSLATYTDGSTLAQLGPPDMRVAIGYCLNFPDRAPLDLPALDLPALGRLSFETPDLKRFPCLRLAQQALDAGAGACVTLNAANEVAVEAFLTGGIGYPDIPRLVAGALEAFDGPEPASVEDTLALDAEARLQTHARLKGFGA